VLLDESRAVAAGGVVGDDARHAAAARRSRLRRRGARAAPARRRSGPASNRPFDPGEDVAPSSRPAARGRAWRSCASRA
jgi:hypothetical protein